MRRYLLSAASLFLGAGALAQTSLTASQFVASRQAEVERLAEIFYNTRLDGGAWTRHDLTACAGFTHHAFVRFDGTSATGAPQSFLAIYDLDHPPARSREQPWQGGITFVRVRPHQENRQDAGPSADYLIAAFNRALKQERADSAGHQPSPASDTQAVASCFIGISDNTPETPTVMDAAPASNETPPPAISGVLIPLAAQPTAERAQYITFDQNGFVLTAGVSVTPR